MKKSLIIFSVFISVFLIQSNLFAEKSIYVSLGGGSGGDSGGSNISIDIGGVTDYKDTNALVAIGLGVIDANDLPSNTQGDKVTGSSYTLVGDRQKDNELAFYGKLGVETIENLFVFVLGGISYVETAEIVTSDSTGLYHEQSSNNTTEGMIGGGLMYFLENPNVGFQLEYDNRRGVTGSIAFKF